MSCPRPTGTPARAGAVRTAGCRPIAGTNSRSARGNTWSRTESLAARSPGAAPFGLAAPLAHPVPTAFQTLASVRRRAHPGSPPHPSKGAVHACTHPIPSIIEAHSAAFEALAITLLAVFVLASAGVPTLAVVEASDPVASSRPSASSASVSRLRAASASAEPVRRQPAAGEPGPVGRRRPPPASPEPSVAPSPDAAPRVPRRRRAPSPPFALTSQPYELPAFVGLGSWQASTVSFYGPGFYCVSEPRQGVPPAGRVASPGPSSRPAGSSTRGPSSASPIERSPAARSSRSATGGRTVVAPVDRPRAVRGGPASGTSPAGSARRCGTASRARSSGRSCIARSALPRRPDRAPAPLTAMRPPCPGGPADGDRQGDLTATRTGR